VPFWLPCMPPYGFDQHLTDYMRVFRLPVYLFRALGLRLGYGWLLRVLTLYLCAGSQTAHHRGGTSMKP
jgi:hypothetical protein